MSEAYVLAPRLGLTDWTFTVKWVAADDESEADGEVDAHEFFNKASSMPDHHLRSRQI